MKLDVKFIIAIAVPLSIGTISGFFTAEPVNGWFTTIEKPSFNPPNWLFAPVWTTLYFLMGIAFYLIWKKQDRKSIKKVAIIFYMAQLVLNFLWVIYFFRISSTRLGSGRYHCTLNHDQ